MGSGRVGSRLAGCIGCLRNIRKRTAGAFDMSRVLVAAAGVLLSILLVGGPAEVSTQETQC